MKGFYEDDVTYDEFRDMEACMKQDNCDPWLDEVRRLAAEEAAYEQQFSV